MTRLPRHAARLLTAGLLAAAATLVVAAPASAHDGLVASTPVDGSTVTTELTSVELEFSDDFLQLGGYTPAFAIQITGPDGRSYNTDCVILDGAAISTPAALGDSGTYSVVWQVVSSDAHPISGTLAFDYTRPDTVTAAAGSPIGATCADDPAAAVNREPAPSPSTTETAAPDDVDTTAVPAVAADGSPSDVIIPIAAGAVLIGAVGSIIGLRLRRKTRGTHGSSGNPAE